MSALIAHVVGARPNFMKAAPVVAALMERGVRQHLIHTGQHYSPELSDVFIRELDLPAPDVNLGVGSGSHATQTAAAMVALEQHLLEVRPTLLVLYGDVNSTLAGAVVAAKLGVPIAHVEAGLRSFDRTMPEEVNRIVTDALADLLFTTSPEARDHLTREGKDPATIHFVGNPMIDTLLKFRSRLEPDRMREQLQLPASYGVVTIHRPSNVDDPAHARRVAAAIARAAEAIPLVIPLHPRGRAALADAGLVGSDAIRIVAPLGYVDFLSLVSASRLAITDSGGVQEETTTLRIPCLTLRPNTERPITITHGTNRLVTPETLREAVDDALGGRWQQPKESPPLWDGRAGSRIAEVIAALPASAG